MAEGQIYRSRFSFSFDCRPKIIIFTHSINFLEERSAPIGCNLNYANFHEITALGLISPENPGLYGTLSNFQARLDMRTIKLSHLGF